MSGVSRQHPIPALIHRPAKGQTEIRNFGRSMRKELEAQEAARLGRPLTKAERKMTKKLAARIAADVLRKDAERRQANEAAKVKAASESGKTPA